MENCDFDEETHCHTALLSAHLPRHNLALAKALRRRSVPIGITGLRTSCSASLAELPQYFDSCDSRKNLPQASG